MNRNLQMMGLLALTVLAAGVLILIGMVLWLLSQHIDANGRVPSGEAFGLTGLLLAFREILGAIKALWAYEDRATMTGHLADSQPADRPTGEPGDPVSVTEEAKS